MRPADTRLRASLLRASLLRASLLLWTLSSPPAAWAAPQGTLAVSCVPAGARVAVPGAGEQTCPVAALSLPPGPQTVEIAAPGYATMRRTLQIRSGERTALDVTLRPALATLITAPQAGDGTVDGLPGPLPGRPILPGHTAVSPAAAQCPKTPFEVDAAPGARVALDAACLGAMAPKDKPAAQAPGPLGRLTLTTDPPGAEIAYAGVPVARTPLRDRALVPGAYTFDLRVPGTEAMAVVEVSVQAGALSEVSQVIDVPAPEDAAPDAPGDAPAADSAAPAGPPDAARVCAAFLSDVGAEPDSYGLLERLDCDAARGARPALSDEALESCAALRKGLGTPASSAATARRWLDTASGRAWLGMDPGVRPDAWLARVEQQRKVLTGALRNGHLPPRGRIQVVAGARAALDAPTTLGLTPALAGALCEAGQEAWQVVRQPETEPRAARDASLVVAGVARLMLGRPPAPGARFVDERLAQMERLGPWTTDAAFVTGEADLQSMLDTLRTAAQARLVNAAVEAGRKRFAAHQYAEAFEAWFPVLQRRATPVDPLRALVAADTAKVETWRTNATAALEKAPLRELPARTRQLLAADWLGGTEPLPGEAVQPALAALDTLGTQGEAEAWREAARLPTTPASFAAARATAVRAMQTWVLSEAKRRETHGAAESAADLLDEAAPLLPGNPALEAERTRLTELARGARTAQIEGLIRDGRIGAAYLLTRYDGRLRDADRQWLLDTYDAEWAQFLADAAPTVEVEGLDPTSRRVLQTVTLPEDSAQARLRAFGDPEAALVRGRLVVDTVEAVAIPPHIVGRSEQTAKYVAGELEVSNPAKHDCQVDVLDRQASLADDQAHYQELYDAYQQCIKAAANAGGWGGALAATGCAGGYVALGIQVDGERRDLSTAESNCDSTPYTLTERRDAEMPYVVETWATEVRAHVRVRLLDAHDGAELWSTQVDDRVEATDTAVFGQPELGVNEDALDLPSTGAMEAALLKRLEDKLGEAARTAAAESWRLAAARLARAADPQEKLDAAALVVTIDERRTQDTPDLLAQANTLRADVAEGRLSAQAVSAVPVH